MLRAPTNVRTEAIKPDDLAGVSLNLWAAVMLRQASRPLLNTSHAARVFLVFVTNKEK